jgi:hypothetical protein
MRTWKLGLILLISLFVLVSLGCAGGSKTVEKKTTPTGEVQYPEWWRTQPNPEYVYSYGTATRVTDSASRIAARADAMQQAAEYVKVAVQGMMKDFVQESGAENTEVLQVTSNVVRVVTDTELQGAQITKEKSEIVDGRVKTYIQLAIPKSAVDKKLVNAIRSDEALYNQFKASQAFQELDEQVQKGGK